jgi:hypothetical protein
MGQERRTDHGEGRRIDYEDVDQVIGLAAEMAHADEGRLSVSDLEDIARQLDIPDRYVRPAVRALEKRRKARAALERRRDRRRRVAGAVLGASLVVLGVLMMLAHQDFVGRLADVERQKAQVRSVLDRREEVHERYYGKELDPSREAELAGADNRVRIEMRRYDEAASAYNARVGSFPGSFWSVFLDVPGRLPLSSEVGRW